MKLYRSKYFLLSTTVCLVFTACQEFLPPRDDPNGYFSMETSVEYDVNVVPSRNQLVIFLKIANTFDETIEDKVRMKGTVTISWIPQVGAGTYQFVTQRTFHLENANIIRAKGYDRNTQLIRIDPGDTITIACSWNFKSDDSTNLFSYFGYQIDNQCYVFYPGGSLGARRITPPNRFKVTAALKLTDRTSVFYFPSIEFEKCFVVTYQAEANPPESPCIKLNGISDYCKLIN